MLIMIWKRKQKMADRKAKVELSVKTARQGNKIMELHHLYKGFQWSNLGMKILTMYSKKAIVLALRVKTAAANQPCLT